MKSKHVRLAAAAVFIAAMMLGAYLLTGSPDGTSITLAQVRQAMNEVDWMKIVNTAAGKKIQQTDWLSFGSKVHVVVVSNIGISYSDYTARTEHFWPERADYIVESPITSKQFAFGAGGPFAFIEKSLQLAAESVDSNIARKRGTFEGRAVEVWTVAGDGQTITVTMDLATKRPLAATYQRGNAGDNSAEDNTIRFYYPESGPADIYEAGAPRSAVIKQEPAAPAGGGENAPKAGPA